MKKNEFIDYLEKEFKNHKNKGIAKNQEAYMRNQFDFYGITASKRREIQKPLFERHTLPKSSDIKEITKILWKKPQRDHQYCAQELILKNEKKFKPEDINLFEFMITHKSWWDTIDFISPKILGRYFQLYPEKIEEQIEKWIFSKNIWLQRSCLLFQLKYKEDLNTRLLTHIIHSLLNSKEFFINKAIGWILREYSKTNEKWVINFTKNTKLSNLSKREALKRMNI